MTARPDQRRARWRTVALAACAFAAGALVMAYLIGRGGSDAPATATATAADPAVVRGAALFAVNCASCHGVAGRGDGPQAATLDPRPIDFTSAIHRGHRDEDLANWIRNGVPGSAMPAFGGTLTDTDIADLIAFIRSLQASAPVPSGTPDVPGPELCTVAPVPPETFKPAGTPVPQLAPTPLPEVGPGFVWPQGVAASDAEVAGITRTIREFYACANAGDYPRRLALYTDRAIRPQFAALDAQGWADTLAFAATPPAIVPEGERSWVDTVSFVRRLPDGRVGAYVKAVDPVNHPHQIDAVVIFAQSGDRWLIDEVHADPSGTMGAPTPTPRPSLPGGGVETPVAAGGLTLTLLEAPTTFGVQSLVLDVRDEGGAPVDGLKVVFLVDMPEMAMGVQEVTAAPDGDGRYRATVPVGMPGSWEAIVTLTRPDGTEIDAVFTFDIV